MDVGGLRTVTAMFTSRTDAEEAVQALRDAGIPEGDVSLLPGYERDPEANSEARGQPAGFWASLTDLFMPAEDRYSYAEGLSRGGYLVTVKVTADMHGTALNILDREGTIDMDESEQAWRSEGWKGYEGRDPDFASPGALATGSLAGSTGVGAAPVDPTDRTAANEAERADVPDVDLPIVEEPRSGQRDTSHGRVRVRSYVVEVPRSD